MTPQESIVSEHPPTPFSQSSVTEADSNQTPSPLKRPQLEIRSFRRGFGIIGLLSTFFVFVVTAGNATLILWWLYAFYDPVTTGGGVMSALRNGSFAITEPSGADGSLSSQTNSETLRILLFSALASHLVSVTSTILVTLLAYRSATQWLRDSENPDNLNLSPIQYGLLVRTLGSGSLMAIINTLRYTCRSKRASAPWVFKAAIIGVTGIYILSHTVGVADLWLHSSARSISVFRAVPTQSDAQFGITYNDTICGPFNKTELPCQNLISTHLDGTYWAYDEQWMYLEGSDTIADSNLEMRLESFNDTVILVPGPDRNFKSIGFIINTHGLQVECTNLRDQCNRMMTPVIDVFLNGTDPVTNCSKAGYPRIPYYTSGDLKIWGQDTRNIQSLVIGIIGDEMGGMRHGTADFSSGWTSNPASTIVQLRWEETNAEWNSGTPGVQYANALDLYVTCELSYLDVTAQYDPIEVKWSILEQSLSSPELASAFWTPMIFQLGTDDLEHTLQPYVTTRGAQLVDVLVSLMAKYGIGYAAPLMQFTAASNVTTPQLIAVGLYPVAPTLLLVSCLYLYSLIALFIFFLACTSNTRTIFVPRQLTRTKEQDEERSALDVAQTWLTDPLPFVGSIFSGGDGRHVTRSVESDPLLQVYDSDWELGKAGIGLYKSSKGEMVFGLMRQSHSRSKRYGWVFSTVDEDSVLQEKVPVHGSAAIGSSLAMIGKVISDPLPSRSPSPTPTPYPSNLLPEPVSRLSRISQSSSTQITSPQPSVSEPDCNHEPAKPSIPPSRPQLEIRTSRKRFGAVGLLPTFCVFVITGGTATLILGWLSAFHDPIAGGGGVISALRNGSFTIVEPSGPEESLSSQPHTETLRILMFSTLASHLVSVTSTILVTLLAYRSATQWLRASESPDNTNLTPIQYGLLVRTLGSGSLMSIINTLRYIRRSRRASAPRFFKEAFVGVTGIYVLSHIVGLLDLWLHAGSRSIAVTRSIPFTADAQYGITYNNAICGSLSKNEIPCQSFVSANGGTHTLWWGMGGGFKQLQAYSTLLDVNPYISLEYINGTAILVPGPTKGFSSKGFTFNTLGLRAKCENLRDQCDTLVAPPVQFLVPGGDPIINCSKAGYPRIPYHTYGDLLDSGRDTRNIESLVLGIIGDEIGGMVNGTADFSSLGWTSNPASAVVQLRWPNVTAPSITDAPGVAYSNAMDLYAACTLEYLDVVAGYDSVEAEWSILETNLTSPELTSVFWSPVVFQAVTSDLLHAVRPYMTNRGSQAMEVLEMTLARSNVGYITPFVTFVSASNVTTPRLVALGLYPTTPTILLIGCLYLYCLVALFIFFLACTSNNKVIFVPRELTKKGEKDEEKSALDVAQTWLTDPLPLIGSLFPGRDGRQAVRSAESDPLTQVYDSNWEWGKVGVGLYKGSKGEMIFGLMRQSHSRSKRYGRLFPVVDEESALQEKVPIHGSTVIIRSLAAMGKAES